MFQTKFKIGDRVVYQMENGDEEIGQIERISIEIESEAKVEVLYKMKNVSEFKLLEKDVLGKVLIQKPRKSRAKKKDEPKPATTQIATAALPASSPVTGGLTTKPVTSMNAPTTIVKSNQPNFASGNR